MSQAPPTVKGLAGAARLRRAAAAGQWLLHRTAAPRRWLGGSRTASTQEQTPLRAELFSADQMEQHGKALAATHRLHRAALCDRLLRRLDDNEQQLIAACRLLTTAVKARQRVAPAGEWLLDNFYLIEEQVQIARRHLPRGYSRELPRLAQGPSAGLPRVYDLALAAISHGDGRVDAGTLARFVAAYQTVTPLTLGELWAIPIMLRLALIENLRRVAARIGAARLHLNQAQDWANRMMEIAISDPKSLILVIADMARSDPPMASAFVAELARRLQGHGQALALPLTWIEQRLAESSLTIEQLVQSENQQQAADHVSISNSIGSLRFLGATDWRSFVESLSLVEQVLRQDPGGCYGAMDFATRDRYRHVIDHLGRHSAAREIEIARAALLLAQRGAAADAAKEGESHLAHVGFYLIDQGLPQLEQAAGLRPSAATRLRRACARQALTLYLGAILSLSLLFTAGLLLPVQAQAIAWARLLPLTLLALLAASQLATTLSNWLASLMSTPQLLPRMDYARGLPPPQRSLVVIPTLLDSAQGIETLLESLEVHFLGNRDRQLHFALLSDDCDAPQARMPEDEALLRQAREGIRRLNREYPGPDGTPFHLLHRPRQWNPAQGVWMGRERKRGKLADLNALLRDQTRTQFALLEGDTAALIGVRYVITLDTDTQLPRDAARQFIAAMAHPLNRPRYDERRQRVVAGYGILQPRMAASLVGGRRSRYAQLCGSEPGIDPYTRSVSDLYQDLFGEGSFIGKGIYEVEAFERALGQRFPDNRILSHDLLEGCHARSGLLSDVHLYEEYPARYLSDVQRQRRWMRGDWQIAHWLLPRVPGADGRSRRNPLSALSRWKIFDNLRRSLALIALCLLPPLGWALLPRPWFWTLATAGLLLMPPLLLGLLDALRKPAQLRLGEHLHAVLQAAARGLSLALFRIACLPYEALCAADALLRSSWRLLITQRHLLEWRSSAEQERGHRNARERGLAASYRSMWIAPLAALTALLVSRDGEALLAATPIAALWLLAPALAWWLSRPLRQEQLRLRAEPTRFLRAVARKTWRFFEHFVNAADHHLPPDNFQEHPGPLLAHRTSPTNIGLSLLANLSACDFGFISTGTLLRRTADTFATLAQLERHQGHFFNWYDTQSLQPLPPRYISSVDSGNLAGHLLTLRAGLLALPEQKIVGARLFEGLADTLALLVEAAPVRARGALAPLQAQLQRDCAAPPATLAAVLHSLQTLAERAQALQDGGQLPASGEAADWALAFAQQGQAALEELLFLAPWLTLGAHGAGFAPLASGGVPSLRELAQDAQQQLPALSADSPQTPAQREALLTASTRAAERIARCEQLAAQASGFASMAYGFLYDQERQLLAIGYNLDEFRRDTSFYDLLASEARLCNFVAIAQGQLPQESWFALGRLRSGAGGEPILLSWSGSMFEYLMPLLVMPAYEGSLLEQTCRAAVARQIAYGRQRALPWGVSECGYSTVDAGLHYQYHAFGVPGLGLKRGLADDSVVAPYASALALMVAPDAACANLQRLAGDGLLGRYGFYEAIDYTPARLVRGESSVVVRSFMAHHQGMSLLALAHLLLDRPMQRRFESDPQCQATLLLLQERIPRHTARRGRHAEAAQGSVFYDSAAPVHTPIGARTPSPEVQLLSNGRYHVMLSNAGGGYSRWKDLALTRWREDSTCDHWGSFIYLRDLGSGQVWSAAHQPTLRQAQRYEAMFSEGRAEYRRRDQDIETYTEIVVSPEDDIELRRLRLSNRSATRKTIEITSYAEVVLAPPAADLMQASFGNLFVQSELRPAQHAILCTRRPRSIGEATPWMFHLLAAHGAETGELSYETDRMRFIGRGNSRAAPQALREDGALSGTAGSVLDPIVAIRCRVVLEAGQSASLDLVFGAADNREACLALVEKYQDRHLADRVLDLAWTHGGVTLRQLNVLAGDAQLYRRLAGSVLYANAALRAEAAVLTQNRRGQSGLWGYAISGDLPIVLLKIADSAQLELARQLIQCHAYWRLKGLAVDLVIWNEDHLGYRQQLQDQIMGLIATGTEAHAIDRPGGIFVRAAEQIPSEDRILLQAAARAIISDRHGSLLEQLSRRSLVDEQRVARLIPLRTPRVESSQPEALPSPPLMLGNALGGFSADGSEYHIRSAPGQRTPLPWCNVLANAQFGTVVSESGLGYTWSENAHEFRLTPWREDAVGGADGEALYLRDEESGQFWSPTPLPGGDSAPYLCRHGFGYSVFEHSSGGIHSELWVYVDLEEAVKFSVLTVRNDSGRTRRLSATGYVEWVLGDLRAKCAMQVITEIDAVSGALFARNAYNTAFSGRVAFLDVDDPSRSLSGDRGEFLGRNGSLRHPEAMRRTRLSGRLGAALDPCGAIQVPFELLAGQQRQIIFRLGAGRDLVQTRELAQRLRKPGAARAALQKVRHYWQRTLGSVQIETPDAALNVLGNGWLLYQTLACRLWARSGFYQSGGAFGFRDQLQDAMALLHAQSGLLRAHLLSCAQRQFPEGDVQHWWHPPAGQGVRTRCSDDYLWLPLATCRYVLGSDDTQVLDEALPFLHGRALGADEESYYDLPGRSGETASLYEHCVRAIRHGLRFGEHGLPLMGSGDWNDGMNLVGIHGKGESVWLGFFLYEVLSRFAPLAQRHGDAVFAEHCRSQAAQLRQNLEQHGWDGQWYRRAWFDDGTPLGSSVNSECRIDSIAQSWSVLSGAGEATHARQAMDAVDRHLVRRETAAPPGLIQLLDPPFDHSPLNPGYIKGYVPGVRENGGQYTHAAIWAAMAFARLGDSRRAWELLDMINPVNHAQSAQAVAIYKAEPYVVAADVYAVAPHVGRGGWSWYTGSAGWLYRLLLESLLGLNLEHGRLRFAPCLRPGWPQVSLRYRHGDTPYRIVLRQLPAVQAITVSLDGVPQADQTITLVDDGQVHEVEVQLPDAG
ncbi:Cellobiose phosphorylase [Solimonas aquatica]|uniref:Cellobiose phosphorylase n=2 Tax=Solimonas aquatica TaxID=489703 RepID=A0A1H9CZ38_9GAMM|nr:glycoside hydrolase family 94 protein [Solimonas aquatica]SEQ06454.1 Cellobiose phosphorylase [Solimonas aquatica]